MVRGLLEKQEDTMKLVSRFEAATRSTAELYGLRKMAFVAFASATRGSQEQRDALTLMRNIERELAKRQLRP